MSFRFSLFLLTLLVSVSTARAQSIPALQATLWKERQERSVNFRKNTLEIQRGVQLFAEYQQAYQRNRMEQSSNCRKAQRKANKDALVSVTARCYRTSLLMEREFWQKHSQQAESLPGVTPVVRKNALDALARIIDAIDTIILGIDSSVYSSEDGLLEAKQNLHKQYRAPALLALSHFRADRTLTWIAHFLTKMLTLVEKEAISEAAFEKLQQASYCLELGEIFMREILTETDYSNANLLLSQSLQHLQTCGGFIREAYAL